MRDSPASAQTGPLIRLPRRLNPTVFRCLAARIGIVIGPELPLMSTERCKEQIFAAQHSFSDRHPARIFLTPRECRKGHAGPIQDPKLIASGFGG